MGARGLGTLEYLNIDVKSIELVTASLANVVGSVGGFCLGSKEAIYHQRLNASGYVFSASSPPYLLVAATKALELITEDSVRTLAQRVKAVRAVLTKDSTHLTAHGDANSPIVHLRLTKSTGKGKKSLCIPICLIRSIHRFSKGR